MREQLATFDWTGLGAFITSIATLLGVLLGGKRITATKKTIDNTITPRVVELHDDVVNGTSTMTAAQKESTT